MPTELPYNPLDTRNLAANVAGALLEREPVAMPPPTFRGAGIYAIYYTGCFEPYKVIAQANRQDNFSIPVYVGKADVGKAVPAGARKGAPRPRAISGHALANRLKQHAASIDQVNNLNLSDFLSISRRLTISGYRSVSRCSSSGFHPSGTRASMGSAITIPAAGAATRPDHHGMCFTLGALGQRSLRPMWHRMMS